MPVAHDADVDRIRSRMDAELAVAVEGDRAEVALGETVGRDDLVAGDPDLVDRVRQLHVEETRRVLQPLEVIGQPEDRRPLRSLVHPDPFEDTGAVVETVGGDMDLGMRPVDELAIHPDLLCFSHDASTKVTRSPALRRRAWPA
jgi:hypothetical protein